MIEIVNETFYKVFKSSQFTHTESNELTLKHFYYDEDLDQKGFILYNRVSEATQYYLIDINM